MKAKNKKICFFGIYDKDYSRNKVLRQGFTKLGYKITDCNVDPVHNKGLKKYWLLYKLARKLNRQDFEWVFVLFPGHGVIPLARVIFGKNIIFDAFLSLYNSNVEDRKVYSKFNPKAWWDFVLDWTSARLAKKVLLDTNEHISYFSKKFNVPKEKFIRVFIGADPEIFQLNDKMVAESFVVHFHGNFIPLQGVEYIIESAKILRNKDIKFNIIGSGSTFNQMVGMAQQSNLQNVIFLGRKNSDEVAQYLSGSDICLGIFGKTNKTDMVIPNKVYEGLAAGKAVVTAKTPAIEELLKDRRNALLTMRADGQSLAEAILLLYNDRELLESIAVKGYTTFRENCQPQQIVENLIKKL